MYGYLFCSYAVSTQKIVDAVRTAIKLFEQGILNIQNPINIPLTAHRFTISLMFCIQNQTPFFMLYLLLAFVDQCF